MLIIDDPVAVFKTSIFDPLKYGLPHKHTHFLECTYFCRFTGDELGIKMCVHLSQCVRQFLVGLAMRLHDHCLEVYRETVPTEGGKKKKEGKRREEKRRKEKKREEKRREEKRREEKRREEKRREEKRGVHSYSVTVKHT